MARWAHRPAIPASTGSTSTQIVPLQLLRQGGRHGDVARQCSPVARSGEACQRDDSCPSGRAGDAGQTLCLACTDSAPPSRHVPVSFQICTCSLVPSRILGSRRHSSIRDRKVVSHQQVNRDALLRKVVLPERLELSTSPLPRECSTAELRQQGRAGRWREGIPDRVANARAKLDALDMWLGAVSGRRRARSDTAKLDAAGASV